MPGCVATGHVMVGSQGAAVAWSFLIRETNFVSLQRLMHPVGLAAVRMMLAMAYRSWTPSGTHSLFLALFSQFKKGKMGAPHVPRPAARNIWHCPSSSLIPGQLGLWVA